MGVPVRTVRFYITEGLLPGPGARGRGASYGREHLLRLRLIRRLAERRVPIAEIRETLTRLSTSEVAALLEEESRKAAELRADAPGDLAPAYVAALLEAQPDGRDGGTTRAPGTGARGGQEGLRGPRAAPPPRPRPSRPRRGPQGGPPAPDPPPAGSESSWRRMELAPGVELHVRGDAGRPPARPDRPHQRRRRGARGAGAPGRPGRPARASPQPDKSRRQDDSTSEDEADSGAGGGQG